VGRGDRLAKYGAKRAKITQLQRKEEIDTAMRNKDAKLIQ